VRDSFVRFWICALLMAVAVGAFWPVIHNGFINYDDPVYVTANAQVQAGLCWEKRPLGLYEFRCWFLASVNLVVAVDRSPVVRAARGGYHLTSVLLHAANTSFCSWSSNG